MGLVREPSGRINNLDSEVREDVELAAEVHARASGVPLMPPEGSDAATVLPAAPTVPLATFLALMEAALHMRRGPRAYLVPSPSGKYNPEPSFRPAINARSRELAARLRPTEVEAYELLYASADAARSKLDAARRANEDAELKDCTFMPVAYAGGQAVEGRALKQAARQAAAAPRSGSTTPQSTPVKQQQMLHRTPQAQQPQQWAAAAVEEDGGDEESDAQFLALEREVREALAGASLTASQLEGGEVAGMSVDPANLRATEEMLLDLLSAGGADGSEGGEEFNLEEMEARVKGLLAGGSGGGAAASSLEALAGELSRWDHHADPTMQTMISSAKMQSVGR